MTDPTVTRTGTPARQPARAPHRPAPPADDVAAMTRAFARARGDARGGAGPLAGQQQAAGRRAPGGDQTSLDPRAELARAAGWRADDARGALDRREAERGGEQALGLVSPSHAPASAGTPIPAPPPHVDPSGFAQLLADLWTRENGRGDRQVRVRFGADAWPATGALMTQSADGLLDVTIDLAPQGPRPATDRLAAAMTEAGLRLGRLSAI